MNELLKILRTEVLPWALIPLMWLVGVPKVHAQNPSAILIQLGVKGITETANGTNTAGYLIKTKANGSLDVTFVPPVTANVHPLGRVAFVDGVNGSDGTNGNGAITSPYKTFTHALTCATGHVAYVFAPGSYAAPGSGITSTNQTDMTLIGLDPANTYLTGGLQYQVTQDSVLNVYGMQLTTVVQLVPYMLTVNLYNNAGLWNLTAMTPSNTIVRCNKDATVTTAPAQTYVVLSNTCVASMVTFVPTNVVRQFWAQQTNITVAQALDDLSKAYTLPAGTATGSLARWSGSNWVEVAAGATNAQLFGGPAPVFQTMALHGDATGDYYAVVVTGLRGAAVEPPTTNHNGYALTYDSVSNTAVWLRYLLMDVYDTNADGIVNTADTIPSITNYYTKYEAYQLFASTNLLTNYYTAAAADARFATTGMLATKFDKTGGVVTGRAQFNTNVTVTAGGASAELGVQPGYFTRDGNRIWDTAGLDPSAEGFISASVSTGAASTAGWYLLATNFPESYPIRMDLFLTNAFWACSTRLVLDVLWHGNYSNMPIAQLFNYGRNQSGVTELLNTNGLRMVRTATGNSELWLETIENSTMIALTMRGPWEVLPLSAFGAGTPSGSYVAIPRSGTTNAWTHNNQHYMYTEDWATNTNGRVNDATKLGGVLYSDYYTASQVGSGFMSTGAFAVAMQDYATSNQVAAEYVSTGVFAGVITNYYDTNQTHALFTTYPAATNIVTNVLLTTEYLAIGIGVYIDTNALPAPASSNIWHLFGVHVGDTNYLLGVDSLNNHKWIGTEPPL